MAPRLLNLQSKSPGAMITKLRRSRMFHQNDSQRQIGMPPTQMIPFYLPQNSLPLSRSDSLNPRHQIQRQRRSNSQSLNRRPTATRTLTSRSFHQNTTSPSTSLPQHENGCDKQP